MGKRKHKSVAPADAESIENGPSKRVRQVEDNQTKNISYAHIDPTFGQRSAIPGLNDGDGKYAINGGNYDPDIDCGDSADAISYLRAVRAEAFTIPSLLVASQSQTDSSSSPSRAIYEDGIGDSRGWYEDGAYTAAPVEQPSWPSSTPSASSSAGRDPQLMYFEAILKRFGQLRERLSQTPPRHAVERLDDQHPSHVSGTLKALQAWKRQLENTNPEAAQLAAMQKATVLSLLRIMASSFLKGGRETLSKRTSRWIWSLLARLPASGELGSLEVGIVRELGKRAVLVGAGLKGIDTQGLDDGLDEDTVEEEEIIDVEVQIEQEGADDTESEAPPIVGPTIPSEHTTSSRTTEPDAVMPPHSTNADPSAADALAAARDRLLARIQDADSERLEETQDDASSPRGGELEDGECEEEEGGNNKPTAADNLDNVQNTRATVDMILTIVGELYGQRDLLEFRDVWE